MATYEMLWDCRSCDSKKLLGKSHRHCPNCGHAQDPSWRYFPPEDEKVAVEDHQFVGADWSCVACDTPNVKIAEFCVNCGAGHDGKAKTVAVLGEQDAIPEPPKPDPPEEGGSGCWFLSLGCVPMVVLAFVVGIFGMFAFFCIGSMWTSETELTVTGHSWERSVQVETLRERTRSEWCKEMPSKAYGITRTKKKKSTKKVKDGQTCKKVNVDNGDGTMSQKQKCTPKFREEPVMAQHCRFKVKEWVDSDKPSNKGGLADKPVWPKPKVTKCEDVGCTRTAKRTETYTVKLVDTDQATQNCELSEMKWKKMAVGSTWTGPKSVLTGSVACKDLVAK